MANYILSIDQGTTSSRVCLFDQSGNLVAQAGRGFEQIFPKPGWVEHGPEDIWKSVKDSFKEVLDKSGILPKQILGIGITNQRETIVTWDRITGASPYNAIVWQCRRTHEFCEKLKKEKLEKMINRKTGLLLDPYFSASKLRWILQNVNAAKEASKKGKLLAGTMDTYLLWKLTGGQVHFSDVSNASRTMLMNIEKQNWDSDLLKLFSVPVEILPQIGASCGVIGTTKGLGFLPDGIPIAGVAGDQQAALFGQTGFNKGDIKCTYGTGSFILQNTGEKLIFSKNRLLTTVAWKIKNQKTVYAIEGGAFVCGAAVQWLRDGLGLIQKSSEVESLASQVIDTAGVEFVPALTGLGAPHWKAEARGIITGLTRGTTKAHVARATLEAMALQNLEIFQIMEKESKKKIKELRVDGGACANSLLMQIQADYLKCKIMRPKFLETTALGAAYLAGLGVGFWSDKESLKKIWQIEREFCGTWTDTQIKKRLSKYSETLKKSF